MNFKLKDFCISLFTVNDFPIYPISDNILAIENETIRQYDDIYYTGKIFMNKNKYYFISNIDKDYVCYIEELESPKGDFFISKSDIIEIDSSIKNVKGKIKTTYGKLLLNSVLLIDPFGDIIPYINDSPFDMLKIKTFIIDKVLEKKIDASMIYRFFTNYDYISTLCELFVPSISKNLLTLNQKVEKKKKMLFKENKDNLNDSVTMVKIENELINLDKELNSDEDSKGFVTDKSFDIHRKRMFSTFGIIEPFGEEKKDFYFAKGNLDDGWDKGDLPHIFNEIRKSIYGRGIDTAKGGAITNDMARIFQDTLITQEDCKTKRGISFKITNNNKNQLINRYIIEDNKTILVTKDIISKYINKTVTLRSPMTCAVKDGNYCYKCCDYLWEIKKLKLLNVIPVKISSSIMMLSMKSMHGTKTSFYQIDKLDKFLL